VDSEKTEGISQQVKSDAISPSLEKSVSLEIIPAMTQSGDHVADQDVADYKDRGQVIGDVQESIAVRRARRNLCKSYWLTTNMIVTYTIPIVEKAISPTI